MSEKASQATQNKQTQSGNVKGNQTDEVLFDRRGPRGRLGVVTLNRPRKLNTLSHAMIRAIAATLANWEDDPEVEQILLTGAGERGLCAGGDIVEIRDDLLASSGTGGTGGEKAAAFFTDEYRLDASTAELRTPYIALMDGFTFGGGVGLSAHSRGYRVVTERSQIAMPETAIGFVPDVGGTWLLGQMPGEIGLHAGLTGARLTAGDALAMGFADHYLPSAQLPEFVSRLEDEPVDALLTDLTHPAPDSPLLKEREWIDEAYGAATVPEILARLEELAPAHPAAAEAAKAMHASSPTSLAATLEVIRRNRKAANLREAIELEYAVGMQLCVAADFLEGVRAQVVDKDRNPQWQPFEQSRVDALFDPEFAQMLNWG